jgi:hypothetical protein
VTTIGPAIDALRAGQRVRRASWARTAWLAMVGNRIVPVSWGVVTQDQDSDVVMDAESLLAEDWEVLTGEYDDDRPDEPPTGSRVRDHHGRVWVHTGDRGSRVNWEDEGFADPEPESWTRVNEFAPLELLSWGYGVD